MPDAPRILILRPGALGDIFRTLPALHDLRRYLPRARIEWLVYDRWREVLAGHPEIDELITAPSGGAGLPGLLAVLRRRRYDITLDFQGTLRSGLLARLSGCRRRYGYARPFGREGNFLFNNRRVTLPDPHLHRVEKNLALVRRLGAPAHSPFPPWPAGAAEDRVARGWLARLGAGADPPVLLCPGSSRRQSYKRWPTVHFARLATLLRRAGLYPLIGWGPGERDSADRIALESGGAAVPLPPARIGELAAVMRRSACVVAGDSGPLHVASALGVPVVGLFGGTDPRLNAPWGPQARFLDGSPGPAGRRRRKRAAARYLAALFPERVAGEVLQLVSRGSNHARPIPAAG